jgi:hypothetical protein
VKVEYRWSSPSEALLEVAVRVASAAMQAHLVIVGLFPPFCDRER